MRVLLDECVPRKFKLALVEHQCRTVPEEGFAGKTNGELLSLAEQSGFEVFLTLDKGIEYEQSLTGRRISVIVFRPKSNRLSDLLPYVQACLVQMHTIRPGQLIRVPR